MPNRAIIKDFLQRREIAIVRTIEFTLPELLKRLNEGQIPMSAKVSVTFDDEAVPAISTEKDPTLALFEQWASEDAQITAEQQAENERIYSEIEKNGIPRVRI